MTDPAVEVFTWKNPKEYRQKHSEKGDCMALKVLEEGYGCYAKNFESKAIAVAIGDLSLLGTVNENEGENSPICSPYSLFCLYPKRKIQSIENLWIKYFLSGATTLLSFPFRLAKIDRVVQLNNKPCDAIAYPELSLSAIKSCLAKLREEFPSHAILFPRIDRATSGPLLQHLESLGFLLIPTRLVHIFHPKVPYLKHSHVKRDMGLLKKSDYTFVAHHEITQADLVRIHALYEMLFVEKHGKESPQLTLQFFQNCHERQLYTFFALRNPQGTIDAFFSYETSGPVMACGPLGYDTSLPKELGLYRMLFAQSLKIASESGFVFNFGGGNEEFKMKRGSQREIGYTAVYCENLPVYRKIPWLMLAKLGHRVTVKILQKVMLK